MQQRSMFSLLQVNPGQATLPLRPQFPVCNIKGCPVHLEVCMLPAGFSKTAHRSKLVSGECYICLLPKDQK